MTVLNALSIKPIKPTGDQALVFLQEPITRGEQLPYLAYGTAF